MTDATLIPKHYTRPRGCEELHGVFFQHRTDRGEQRACVGVLIPGAERMLEAAMKWARALKARVILIWDTAEQAADSRRRAAFSPGTARLRGAALKPAHGRWTHETRQRYERHKRHVSALILFPLQQEHEFRYSPLARARAI